MTGTDWIFALVIAVLWASGLLLYQSDRVTENLRPPLSLFDFLHAIIEGSVFVFLPLLVTYSRRFFHWPLILFTVALIVAGFSLRFLRRKIPTF